MLCLAPSLHKVRYNRDLWKQTQIHKNYPCQLFTIVFTFFSILSAEFGDYDSPDISANYLEDFKICPDQVSRYTNVWFKYCFVSKYLSREGH